MSDISTGSARKTKATSRKATASSTKARKASARGKLTTPTEALHPDSKIPTPKDQDQSPPQEEPKPSRFAKEKGQGKASTTDQQWQKGRKARQRAQHNEEKKKAKRERKIRDEAERASARAKAKAEAEKAHARAQAEANARRPRPPPFPPRQSFPFRGPRTLSPKQRYDVWAASCTAFFADPDASVLRFPMPRVIWICEARKCIKGEKLGFCHHQLLAMLMGSGEVNAGSLKKERLRWHPDKFPGREEVGERAQEMFQMLQRLIDCDRLRD